jgi:hypothetical protein
MGKLIGGQMVAADCSARPVTEMEAANSPNCKTLRFILILSGTGWLFADKPLGPAVTFFGNYE